VAKYKHTYWGRQIDNLAHELSRLAIVCDIELGSAAHSLPKENP